MSASLSIPRLTLLFFAVLVLHCAGNWALPLIDRDEPRFAEATREMRQRHDWVVPTFNGEPRYDKPPLIYWMQGAACALLGENDFAVRLPSAFCAALTAVALALWGARWRDAATGWRAALIFSLCLQVTIHARAAVADFPMILAVTLAAWAGWESLVAPDARRARIWWMACWIAFAFGFLAKGPIALVPIGMIALAQRGNARRWSWRAWLGGLGVWLMIVSVWGVPALLHTHGEFAAVGLGRHVVARFVVAFEGHGASSLGGWLLLLPFYFLVIWPGAFPWTLWLLPAWRHYRAADNRGPFERYLISGAAFIFGIFTLGCTKLPHYTLPAFPFLALLLASWWGHARSASVFRKTAAASAGIVLLAMLIAPPLLAPSFPSWQLWKQAGAALPPETALAAVAFQEPSLVWYFRGRLRGFVEPIEESRLEDWLAQPGPRAAIVPRTVADARYRQLPSGWHRWTTDGYQLTHTPRVSLVLIYRPPAL